MPITLSALYRYPVKGLSPEPLAEAILTADDFFPCDRLFALENGPSGFDPENPSHQPKIKYLMLMRNARLARLRSRYDEATGILAIEPPEDEAVQADLATADGRAAIERFFTRYCADKLKGPVKLLAAPAFRFADSRKGFVSLINLETLRAISADIGRPLDPLRFRANLYVEGLPAWAEFDLIGQTIAVGDTVRLEGLKKTDRCPATGVDPATGIRDLDLPDTLFKRYGHIDCGIYLRVAQGGRIAPGQTVSVA